MSLSRIPSSSIHVVANGKTSIFDGCIILCVCVCACACVHAHTTSLSIHLSMDIFHSLAIVDIAAVNIGVQVPFWITTFVSLG